MWIVGNVEEEVGPPWVPIQVLGTRRSTLWPMKKSVKDDAMGSVKSVKFDVMGSVQFVKIVMTGSSRVRSEKPANRWDDECESEQHV